MRRLIIAAVLFACAACARADEPKLLLREPALSKTQVVFTFAGDLWLAPRAGGDAVRLTAGPGRKYGAHFSPDGSQIAFTAEYDGNIDVYVMPASGGVPKRITWHPFRDDAVGWTPDGKRILFVSGRDATNDGITRLYTVSPSGGSAEALPLPRAFEGSESPDGSHIAYVPNTQWQDAWKRYRGGQAKKVWIAVLSDSSIVKVPRKDSNDFDPMWTGRQIYFLSDRDGPTTLYRYDTESKAVTRCLDNRGLDLKSASAGPGATVYEQFGSLHLYDLATAASHPIPIHVNGDLAEVRPHRYATTRVHGGRPDAGIGPCQ